MRNTLFIGGGNMAYAILGGLLKTGTPPQTLHVIEPNPQASEKIAALGIACTTHWPTAFTADQVVLAVKPQVMQSVLEQYASHLGQALIISIAAGIGIDQLRQWSQQPQARVVRCMPNTPALVGQGVSALFESCGKVITVPKEADINAITAISGSGPGYVFFLMEAFAQAAQALGFSEEGANLLVGQTFLGSATLATQSSDSFATLREKVTSKGGTTFAGLEQLRAHEVAQAIIDATQAAKQRAEELQAGSKP
jgi:pyrroline-5-carboxylate reductase